MRGRPEPVGLRPTVAAPFGASPAAQSGQKAKGLTGDEQRGVVLRGLWSFHIKVDMALVVLISMSSINPSILVGESCVPSSRSATHLIGAWGEKNPSVRCRTDDRSSRPMTYLRQSLENDPSHGCLSFLPRVNVCHMEGLSGVTRPIFRGRGGDVTFGHPVTGTLRS